ncbi:MAG TPA: hypothetical protein VGM31_21455, partial [Puia sp.]
NLETYASRANTSTTNTFAIGNTKVTVQVNNNLTNKASFSSISPSSGSITVNISGSGSYNYLNGFTLTEIDQA